MRAEQTDGRQPMKWSGVDWTATEAVVGRIQDRILRAAKIKRPRLEPDDEQSSCPVLRGLGSGNGARLPDWIGGLVSLALLVVRARRSRAGPRAAAALRRFSRYGAIFVMGIAFTGLMNTWHMLDGRLDIARPYDRVLFAKVAFFTMMVTVAALNRYRLVPRLTRSDPAPVFQALSFSIAIELFIGAVVLLAVSALGLMNPYS